MAKRIQKPKLVIPKKKRAAKKPSPIYFVQGIVGYRRRHGEMQFCIKWKGYTPFENTWEPLECLRIAKEWVYAYLEDNDLDHLIECVKDFYGDA
ncbi:unnamed protein product [Caenorhabditis brenneri]